MQVDHAHAAVAAHFPWTPRLRVQCHRTETQFFRRSLIPKGHYAVTEHETYYFKNVIEQDALGDKIPLKVAAIGAVSHPLGSCIDTVPSSPSNSKIQNNHGALRIADPTTLILESSFSGGAQT